MRIIGIDPGKSGGIAYIDSKVADSTPMPKTERDIWEELEWVKNTAEGPVRAYLEKVHSMPGQGVRSTFTFGMGYGGLRMALTGLNIPFEDVRPNEWQKALGCQTKGDKNVTKQKAQQLFPHLKITHAIADSLLIAEYGRTRA